jgi:hypothetical protein
VLFGVAHPALVAASFAQPDRFQWVHGLWLATYFVATLYTFAWDVRVDWKLGDLAEGGLRARRMFPHTWIYWTAIAIDFVLRWGWTATLVPHWFQIAKEENIVRFIGIEVLPLVTGAELCRRAMWAVLRLETEHLHNTEGFRRVDVVPLHFDHAPPSPGAAAGKLDSKPSTRRIEALVELLVYATVVGLLCAGAVQQTPMDQQHSPPPALPPPLT